MLRTLLSCSGAALVTAGCALAWLPLGLIVAGGFLLFIAWEAGR